MKILQANMHRSLTADSLLPQLMMEHEADVAIISEQYAIGTTGTWLEDTSATAAVWVTQNSDFNLTDSGRGNGFAWASSNCLTIMSCYLTPSDSTAEFQAKLDDIEDTARRINGDLIMAGDFNSKAVEWGMPMTNSRGRRVLDMSARLGLVVANTGNKTTFRRPGCVETTPDITLVSENYVDRLQQWTVLEDYTGSDHQYISFVIRSNTDSAAPKKNKGARKWNVSKLNAEKLIRKIDENIPEHSPDNAARQNVEITINAITEACKIAMPRIKGAAPKKVAYWWTDGIRQLRQTCLLKRRKYTRAKKHGPAEDEHAEYKTAKIELKTAIENSKREKWEELRRDINYNPWGLGYKIVMKKLGARKSFPELEESTMENIVETLFPSHELRADEPCEVAENYLPFFTQDELQSAASTLKNNKAPGPDGIPSEVLRIIATERPHVLLDMYNSCLSQGVFPEIWKRQRLVLISKGKGDPATPSAYRPLCMLDTAGKLLERMLKPRLTAAINNAGGLSPRQHGFISGRSTIGAIEEVVKSVDAARIINNYSRPVVLIATIDVKNAFNSAKWTNIIDALEDRFKTPAYLMRMIRSYLKDRLLIYDTNKGQRTKKITSGAAQGSILGPDLWNVSYDGILNIEMPDDCYLVGYADDIAAVISARDTDAAARKLTQVMIRTQTWLDAHGLKLAAEKTELILLTRKHIPLEVDMRVHSETIKTSRVLKYLGVRLDNKLTYWAQIQHAAEKAAKITASLSRLMANIGGPLSSRRKLLMDITLSILLYGSEVWADTLHVESRRKVLARVQRTAALRVASAYRTVSEAAVLVISRSIPIDLLAAERKNLWALKKNVDAADDNDRTNTRGNMRTRTIQRWQERWSSEITSRWTAKLIPQIDVWFDRPFGEVDYHLTQLLSGHGYFRKYLCNIGKADSPDCIYGDATIDDANHTFFMCERWKNERECIEAELGRLNAENIIEKMLISEENWRTIARYVEHVLRTKKRDLEAVAAR